MKFHLPVEKTQRLLYIILLSLAGAIAALFVIGSIYGIARPNDAKPLFKLGGQAERRQAAKGTAANEGDIRVFSGLGRLRIPLADSSTMVLSIAFPYSSSDTAFTEELAGKISELRNIAVDYFVSLPEESLAQLDSEAAKQEVLRRYNAVLRLGRIEALYFSDMLIIDGS